MSQMAEAAEGIGSWFAIALFQVGQLVAFEALGCFAGNPAAEGWGGEAGADYADVGLDAGPHPREYECPCFVG